MIRKLMQFGCASISIVSLLFLASCGGSGSSGGSSSIKTNIIGVAAKGAALANATITLTDSSVPVKTVTTTTDVKGNFSFDVSGLTAPFIFKAVYGNITLYSVQDTAPVFGQSIIVNITPITTAITGVLSTTGKPAGITTARVTSTKLTYVKTYIQESLKPSLEAANVPTDFDPINDSFVADGTGFDSVIDNVVVAQSSTNELWLADKNMIKTCPTLYNAGCYSVSDPGNTTTTDSNVCGFDIATGAAVPCDSTKTMTPALYDANALVTTGTPTFTCTKCIIMDYTDFISGIPVVMSTLTVTGITPIPTTITPPTTTQPTTLDASISTGSANGYACVTVPGAIDRCSYITSCAAKSGNGSGYYQSNLGTYRFSSSGGISAAANAVVNACVQK
jgi:hypothetical protein